jgi:hypothetical protein
MGSDAHPTHQWINFLPRQIEQLHSVTRSMTVSISKRTAPQWQLPM